MARNPVGVKGAIGTDREYKVEDTIVNTPVEDAPVEDTGKKSKKRKKVDNSEYLRTIQKIASYSGITRTMKIKDKNGQFDEIVNIYVYPNGAVTTNYDKRYVDKTRGDHTISKQAVRDAGSKNLSFWGRAEDAKGLPQKRVKKLSKPMKRVKVLKRASVKKRR